MAWPPVSNGANVIIKGSTTTIVWGTGGFAVAGLANAIVKNIKFSTRTSEFPIENGAGLTAQEVLVLDGLNAEITVEDDSAIPWPQDGTNISIVIPNMIVNGNISNANITCLVINNDYNGARKTAGERVIMAKSFNLFTS